MENTPAKTTYGKAVRAERKLRELTQEQLAKAVGTSQQNIGGIEAGRSLPRPDLHDKLVQFFGKHSPIAALPPRDEILLAANAIANAQASSSADVIDVKSRPISNTEMAQWWTDGAAKSAKEMEDAIGEALPQALRNNLHQRIDSGKRALRPDYISDRLVVEWKFVSGPRLDTASRIGMQQLCVFKAALAKQSAPPRRFILALVTMHLDAMRGSSMLNISEEADMLGIEVYFCNDGGAVAHTVEQIESGQDELDEVDYYPPVSTNK